MAAAGECMPPAIYACPHRSRMLLAPPPHLRTTVCAEMVVHTSLHVVRPDTVSAHGRRTQKTLPISLQG